jgi:ketosteroid isomerase-like protein
MSPSFGTSNLRFPPGKGIRRAVCIAVAILAAAALFAGSRSRAADRNGRAELLRVREAVWRAWFADDVKTLHQLVPPGTIVISAGEEKWKNREEVFQSAAEFHTEGGKLLGLQFPRTRIQRFGDVAILWSKYRVETEVHGKKSVSSGRVTEIFVRRGGRWTNPGWHTDSGK